MNVDFGAIEVPGEANPLTEGILYHVLRSAASSNPTQIQTGTKQLQEWEKARGFYPLLQSVFLDRSLPIEVRYLAIIQLKNGIDKYWRKTATNAVNKEDKATIRARLLESAVSEGDQRLALQNALVVAKIVRFEFPHDWPDLFQQLLQVLRASTDPNASRLQLPRALLVLLYIVKELSTGRLLRTRQNLQTVTPEILSVLGTIYVNKVQSWQTFFRDGGDDEGGAIESIENSLLAIKIIRRLIIAGYDFPGREKDVQEFWTLTRTHFGDFLQYVSEDSPLASSVQKMVEKHLMQLSKLHLNMAVTHPADFVHLPNSLDLVRDYWSLVSRLGETWGSKSIDDAKIGTDGDAEDEAPIIERLGLKGLLLIRACVKLVFYPLQSFRYKQQQEKDEKTQATQLVKSELLTDDLVREMISSLVTRFFVFRASDLRMWEEEPDEWEKMEEGAEDWEFSIRPCAEKLFLDLAKNFKDLIVQPLLQVFYSVATPDNEDILFKDSVYTAIGLAADILHDQLDFDSFMTNTLVVEVGKQKPGFNIIRRRIAIIIAQWISIKIANDKKPIVYQIYQHLLDKSDPLNDQVVRVTAGRKFNDIANEWEFRADNFLPYAPVTLDRLMALVQEVELADTKMALLNTISIVVERLEHHITPYANSIISLLPPLWEQSGEEHLMKQAVLTLLARLTNAMKADSRSFHMSFLPIIQSAIEPGSETQVYLLEDALDLWSSIIAQTPSAPEPTPPELLNLLQYLLPLFTMDNDTLRKAIEITEAYLLLAPAAVLADDFRPAILQALADLLGNLKPEANGIMTHLVQCIIRGAEGVGGEQAVKILTADLISTGFLAKVLEGLHGAWTHHQSHGPYREMPSRAVDGVVETDHFTVLARIGLASPTVLLEALASVGNAELESTLDWLLEEWFSHIENIGDAPNKKLMTLVLTRLLETGQPWALSRLQNLFVVWTDVLAELLDGMDDRSVDSLYWPPEPTPYGATTPAEPEAPEDVRKRELIYSDPVHRINLVAFVREHLQRAVQAAGGEQRFQEEWLGRVDKDVLKGFGELGIM
ncbi:ARM repeat-containing protein [Dothidotthia symphoricarpi CBS 119687]|uniref:ARM repeat-containing protein n=1 Tax=Dothidotthia symphoricarpi CBS 119687 TaxID=1392245 RepID=A0A6A6A017_9PLEO|nr:ARM repeat-containing protein [Dothidotthia symphoricarpi CBS 119687]KAF2124504.1 ARM repeat-containing protein [Dothidotthia symphoricarpi CBS 119687]